MTRKNHKPVEKVTKTDAQASVHTLTRIFGDEHFLLNGGKQIARRYQGGVLTLTEPLAGWREVKQWADDKAQQIFKTHHELYGKARAIVMQNEPQQSYGLELAAPRLKTAIFEHLTKENAAPTVVENGWTVAHSTVVYISHPSPAGDDEPQTHHLW